MLMFMRLLRSFTLSALPVSRFAVIDNSSMIFNKVIQNLMRMSSES